MSAQNPDPLTIICDITINGEKVQWVGATALYREIALKEGQGRLSETAHSALRSWGQK